MSFNLAVEPVLRLDSCGSSTLSAFMGSLAFRLRELMHVLEQSHHCRSEFPIAPPHGNRSGLQAVFE